MPTYEYECKRCKHRFDAFQSITADPLTRCPECGRKQLQRLIGAGAGVIFRGSGFYATDYKRGSATGRAATSSEPSRASDSGSKGSSEPSGSSTTSGSSD